VHRPTIILSGEISALTRTIPGFSWIIFSPKARSNNSKPSSTPWRLNHISAVETDYLALGVEQGFDSSHTILAQPTLLSP
jgi:hypothetical protein